MGVKPEHVLEEHRIAAQLRIEDADMKAALQGQQDQGNGQHRRTQHHNQAGGIVRPDKQRQPSPGQSGGPHAVDRHNEIQAGEDRRKAGDQHAHRQGDDMGL